MSRDRWRDRIVAHAEIDPRQLVPHDANWRIHPDDQRRDLEHVLDATGWIQPVIVNRPTMRIVDGHLRVYAAMQRGDLVPVDFVELDDDEERIVLATFDPVAALATGDNEKLRQLLAYTTEREIDVQAIADALVARDSDVPAGTISPWRQVTFELAPDRYATTLRRLREIGEAHRLPTNLDVLMWLVWQHERSEETRCH